MFFRAAFRSLIRKTHKNNGWFDQDNVEFSVMSIVNMLNEDNLKVGLFIATSPDKLYQDWVESTKESNYISHLASLSSPYLLDTQRYGQE